MQLGDYPSAIVASQSVTLYGYVGNQMGIPMYYDVMVKLGDNTTTIDPVSRSRLFNNSAALYPIMAHGLFQ